MKNAVKINTSFHSREAIELAKENARSTGAEIEFLPGSLFMPVRKRRFDVIVSNPPYIPSGDIAGLDEEVREYEPRLALDGGSDGLDFYRDITASAKKHLKNGGRLIFEVGQGQAEAVAEMLDGYDVKFVEDYNNPPIKRVVSATLTETVEEEAEENDYNDREE